MGVYGNMMSYFQVQFIDLEYFDMLPKINAGYDITKDKEGNVNGVHLAFRGCFQNLTGNEAKDSNGNLVYVVSGDLWSDTKLSLGLFVKNPLEAFIYRLQRENAWNKEGEFYSYKVVQVVGDDGTLTNDIIFDKGEDKFV
jgi:hypothetical protein